MMQLALGVAITSATWLGLRALVGAPPLGSPGPGRVPILALDALAPFAGLALFTLPTARPILAGLAVMCLAAGMGVADRVKRVVLDEPVVFADRSELLEVVRHPRLYLAFVGVWRMAAATALCVAAVALLVHVEPPLWRMSLPVALLLAVAAAIVGRALFVLPTFAPIRTWLHARYVALAPSRDPKLDAARFGLLAACAIQATIARVERPGRQRAARERPWPAPPPDAGPIVIVQGESFVDVRRLHPDLAGILPEFARLRREGVRHGRLEVPCWGANTIRSELAVLAGLGPEQVGLDRYNPYEHFARVRLPSLAWSAKAAGYRTVCIHPYDADFYARDKVMPLLGFDAFVGIEGFAGAARDGPYVGDAAVAERAAELIAAHGPKLLLFVITMENHGPWDAKHDGVAPWPLPGDWRGLKDATAIGRWLRHLDATDAMIPVLRRAIGERGWLLFYGDHQPSLAGAFRDAADRRTDYVIWRAGADGGEEADTSAERLPFALLEAMGARHAPPPSKGGVGGG